MEIPRRDLAKMEPREAEAAGYLAAIIDGEGSIDTGGKRVRVSSTTPEILDATEEACDLLQIEYKRRAEGPRPGSLGTKPVWTTFISRRDNLKRLSEVVDLRCPNKRHLLHNLVNGYKQRTPEEQADFAREANRLTWEEKMTTTEVAAALGSDSSSVRKIMKKHGYNVRTPAEGRKLVRERVDGKPLGVKQSKNGSKPS